MGISWLDFKLGLRMLVRYPGLSVAGGFAIAMVIVCGTAAGIFDAVINGSLPFEEGDRVVAIENWDTKENGPAPHDFLAWRDSLKTVQDVGAYRLVTRNLAAEGHWAEPERIAEISAAAFRVARVPPLFGRYLVPDDEREGAAEVAVIGYEEWQGRFAGDPNVVGRTLQVGEAAATIVGVMPKGFGFPVNEAVWVPLRLRPSDFDLRQRPSNMPYKFMPQGVLHVFGRLAPGADLDAARAELAVVGQRTAIESPQTHRHVRPRILPYARWFFDEQHDGETLLVQALVGLLLGIVGANVAVLVYARTATRRVELALRAALGASRRRIVGQMFAEGFALSGVAAVVGLGLAALTRDALDSVINWEQAPFWIDTSVTSGTALMYVLAIAVLGAVIVGAIPALQATSRRAQTGLQQAAAGVSGWRVGRTYGALIVVQVALAVAILPYAFSTAWNSVRQTMIDPGFPAGEILTARVQLASDSDAAAASPAFAARLRDRQVELVRRLESEPEIANATFLTGVPGSEPKQRIDLEGGLTGTEVGVGRLGLDFIESFGLRVAAGRGFDSRDIDPSARRIIVNRSFARDVVGGHAIGRRVRESGTETTAPGPWLEIVGVVEDFPAVTTTPTAAHARFYYAVPPGDSRFALIALRVRGGSPALFANRLREVTTELDRGLLLRDVRSMDSLLRDQRAGARLGAWVSGLSTLSLLLLSATGLYALMAFTVAQRRQEIGIRMALGAEPGGLLGNVFARAIRQLGTGIAIGVLVAGLLHGETGGEATGGGGLVMLPLVAAFVLLVGLAAAAGPARRALRIQPSEVLKQG